MNTNADAAGLLGFVIGGSGCATGDDIRHVQYLFHGSRFAMGNYREYDAL